jgi:serine/threonine-protein kinase RsbT
MTARSELRAALRGHLSAISIDALLQRHVPDVEIAAMPEPDRQQVAIRFEEAVALFSATSRAELRQLIRAGLGLALQAATGTVERKVVATPIRIELDVSVARNAARKLAAELGFSASAAVKVATGVSELARNIILYAGEGSIEVEALEEGREPKLRVRATDQGPGIPPALLEAILHGKYRSRTGLGKGIVGVKRVANAFSIESKPGAGTTVLAEFRAVS